MKEDETPTGNHPLFSWVYFIRERKYLHSSKQIITCFFAFVLVYAYL